MTFGCLPTINVHLYSMLKGVQNFTYTSSQVPVAVHKSLYRHIERPFHSHKTVDVCISLTDK